MLTPQEQQFLGQLQQSLYESNNNQLRHAIENILSIDFFNLKNVVKLIKKNDINQFPGNQYKLILDQIDISEQFREALISLLNNIKDTPTQNIQLEN